MADLNTILNQLIKTVGIETAIVVSRDGFILDAVTRNNEDAEAIGAIVSTGVSAIESIGSELDGGKISLGMFEYENRIVLTAPLGADAILTVSAQTGKNLGVIRYQVKKTAGEILDLL